MSKISTRLYNEDKKLKRLNIASVTMQCDPEPDINRARMISIIDEITAAHLNVNVVMFGEMILCWYAPGMQAYNQRVAEPIPSATSMALSNLAAEKRLFICFGLLESGDDGALHNTQVLINPQGEIQAVHRKCNLKPGERQAGFQPGAVPVTVTEILGVKTGLVICSDAANPRTMWELAKSRLDLILLSLADDRDEGRFMAKFNARMYDAWIATANRFGDENGYFWNGHTVISDPLGRLRATLQNESDYLVYELYFDTWQPLWKRTIRNILVKVPLPFHILKNWSIVKDYY